MRYRLGRTRETLEEAFLMRRESHWNACVNRLYYACFYSVTALLAIEGISLSKHSGVKSLFNHHRVKTNKISKELGRLYNNLFEKPARGRLCRFCCFSEG
ncbi:MAG: HEPN domain-containing protein [bacterium]